MTVQEFVEGYEKVSNEKIKESFIEKIVMNKYVNYEDKCNICNKIIASTTTRKINGKKYEMIDSTMQHFMFVMALFENYTKLDVIPGEQWLKDFNMLEENDLTQKILAYMPKQEIDRFNEIMASKLSDYYDNYRSLIAYIDQKIEKYEMLFKDYGSSISKLFENKINELYKDELND